MSWCCILFHFYIKPQRTYRSFLGLPGCILFHFYIKPQLCGAVPLPPLRCILFHFYIKPQRLRLKFLVLIVVSYSISTSNHNGNPKYDAARKLYLIPFLHQTTTRQESCHRHSVVSYSISTSNHNLWRIRRYFSSTLSPKSHSHFQRNAVV